MKRGFWGRLAAWILMGTLLFGGVIAATPAPVVQAAEISETSVVLRKGTSITLSVSGKYKSIRWGSSNTKVATVTQKGRVKAIAPGTAKITATANGKTYTCTVRVAKAYTWRYGGHKYQLIEYGMTWSRAKKYCESIGGHLAVITSAKEQASVRNALKKNASRGNYWLGARKNTAGQFRWVTGEPFRYTAFAGDQPDHFHEKCLMIYTYNNPNTRGNDRYRWNDLVNAGTYGSESWFGLKNFGFICEWE